MYRGSPLRSTVVNTNVITVNACCGSFIRENGKKSRTKCSFLKCLAWNLEEASHEMLVLEASSVNLEESIAQNARFWSVLHEIWRKSRTKCSGVLDLFIFWSDFIFLLIFFYFFWSHFNFFLIRFYFFLIRQPKDLTMFSWRLVGFLIFVLGKISRRWSP